MPYVGPDDPTLPLHVRALDEVLRRQWLEAFQSAFARCQSEGMPDCDGQAMRAANAFLARRRSVRFTKADADRRLVFGWANVAVTQSDGRTVIDLHDDQIALEELERAAYEFVLGYRLAGDMHRGEARGRLVESMVVTPDKLEALGLPRDALPGGWWVGFKIEDDELFERIKSGERPMFSIQGRGERRSADAA